MRLGVDARLWSESGVGRYIRNLLYELSRIDTQNSYLLFALTRDKKNIREKIRSSKFEVRNSDIRWHTYKEQRVFKKIIDGEGLDLVHFPYFSLPVGLETPYVVTIHDLILHHFPTGEASTRLLPFYWLKLQGYKYVISKGAKNSKKIITVSNSTKKEISEHLKVPEEKVSVIYEGLDKDLSHSSKTSAAQNAYGKYFLVVGNAYPHKNLDFLVNAFENFRKDAKLIFVGQDDFFFSRLEEKAKLKLGERVILLRNVKDYELSSLYSNSLSLLRPSLMEGFSLPALEAMSLSCPLILSDIPVHREICKDAAFYFDPRDESELLSLLEKNYKEKDIEKIKLGKKIAEEFSWKKAAEKTLEVYESSVGIRQN